MDIRKVFADYVTKENLYGKDDPLELFHPSSSGYCKRQIFRSKANLTRFSFPIKGAMNVGSILHDWAEETLFKPMGAVTEGTVEVSGIGKTFFRGKYDVLYRRVVYDLKFVGKAYLPKVPFPHHVSQLNCYMLGAGVKVGRLVYVSKINLAVKVFEFEFSKELYVSDALKAKEVYDELLKWKEGDEIPFEKCGCYFCENEFDGK